MVPAATAESYLVLPHVFNLPWAPLDMAQDWSLLKVGWQ